MCTAWIPTDRGFYMKPDQECQFYMSLSEAAAVFLYDEPRLESVRARIKKRFQIMSLSLWQEKVVRHLGQKVRWLDVKTNVLFQKVLNFYNTICHNT